MELDPSVLTPRQRQVLAAVRALASERGFPPTVREAAQAAGLKSPATAHACLKVLKSKGFLTATSHRARALLPAAGPETPPPIPLLDQLDFSARSTAVVGAGTTLPWRDILAGEGLYAFKVRGTAMAPELDEGDYAVVRPQPAVMAGSLVAVVLDGEAAVRRLVEIRKHLYLKAFSAERPLLPLGTREVLGRVIAVVRACR